MEQYLVHFGQQLKSYRLAADMTQTELAARLGVQQPYINKLESAKLDRQPSLPFLLAVSDLFNVGLDDLLGIKKAGQPTPNPIDSLPPEVRGPIEELVRQLGQKQKGDRWKALANTVKAVGGDAAVERASRELGVTVTPDREAELIRN